MIFFNARWWYSQSILLYFIKYPYIYKITMKNIAILSRISFFFIPSDAHEH